MFNRGVAQSGLAHLNGVQGVGGSNPLAPINNFNGLQIFCSPFLCHFFLGVQIGVQGLGLLKTKKADDNLLNVCMKNLRAIQSEHLFSFPDGSIFSQVFRKKGDDDVGVNREESLKKELGGPTRSRWRQNMSPPEENKAQYNGNEEEKIRNRSLCKGKTLTGEEGSDLSPI